MIGTLIGWVVVLLSLVCMLPWARGLLHNAEARAFFPAYNPLLLALTTLGLSMGALSLAMLWLGLLGRTIDWQRAMLICAVLALMGLLMRGKLLLLREEPLSQVPGKPFQTISRAAWIVIGVIAALILFNAVYWPFGIDDAVTIYATFGRSIATWHQLPAGNLYELYPMLVPLNYAFAFQASGWTNEYLAGLFPALLSIGVIGVAYLLGRELYNRAAGLIAALLVALAPMMAHWASTGYVDLPAGFYYGMSALFLARHGRTRAWSDALLAGIMAGLAAWTKNSALLIVPAIAVWIGYRLWQCTPVSWRHIGLMGAGFVTVAGPWYIRNLTLAGMLVPPTGWTWKAERTLANLFPYLADPRYGVVGPLFTAGLIFILWRLWRSRGGDSQAAFLTLFTLPFFAIWWALFSYDGRFLLVLTPLVAVTGAALIEAAWRLLPVPSKLVYLPMTAVLIVLLALPAISSAVDFKFDILRHPFMSDADKHRLKLGADRYNMARYLRTLPQTSRIWTQDLLLPYPADSAQVTVGEWPTPAQLAGYDYWVVSEGDFSTCNVEPAHREGPYLLYNVGDVVKSGGFVCPPFLGTRLSR